jgi:hypothetical protein
MAALPPLSRCFISSDRRCTAETSYIDFTGLNPAICNWLSIGYEATHRMFLAVHAILYGSGLTPDIAPCPLGPFLSLPHNSFLIVYD